MTGVELRRACRRRPDPEWRLTMCLPGHAITTSFVGPNRERLLKLAVEALRQTPALLRGHGAIIVPGRLAHATEPDRGAISCRDDAHSIQIQVARGRPAVLIAGGTMRPIA